MKDKNKKKAEEQTEEVVLETVAEESPSEPDPTSLLEAALTLEKDRYLRLAAEYDNYRKRNQKEREALYVELRADVASKFLPVYDSLDRALQQETADEAFLKGIELTMTQLCEILEGLGIHKIPAVGEPFNPELHEAVFHVEDEQYGQNEVIEQFLTGFILGEKVIRHSVVKVAN